MVLDRIKAGFFAGATNGGGGAFGGNAFTRDASVSAYYSFMPDRTLSQAIGSAGGRMRTANWEVSSVASGYKTPDYGEFTYSLGGRKKGGAARFATWGTLSPYAMQGQPQAATLSNIRQTVEQTGIGLSAANLTKRERIDLTRNLWEGF